MFLQRAPTKDWSIKDVEMLLSEAYRVYIDDLGLTV